jgi:isoleucyl-tRNA synthetase
VTDSADAKTVDVKSTVFLPDTLFPMRAGLAAKEPEILAGWEKLGLYERQVEQAQGRAPFVLHDGPPFANGHIHIGHATNKILKDVINRSQRMLGKQVRYVPGWDCHGLPIEWKIEEKYRAKGADKDQVPVVDFRRECREFAQGWIDTQRAEFKRLGVLGDWDNPYTTMTNAAEAQIVAEIHKFVRANGLYKGVRPVMWSVVEKTALADAEVEYATHRSTTIFVKFPIVKSPVEELVGASIVIWTTTPWTIPGNRAVAYGDEIEYTPIKVIRVLENAMAKPGEVLLVATERLSDFVKAAGIEMHMELPKASYHRPGELLQGNMRIRGQDLAGTICKHPLAALHEDYAKFEVPALAGDFVTTDTGTGFVHIAPGHGGDDFALGQKHGIEVPRTVGEDGVFYPNVALFAGKRVYTPQGKGGDANKAVIEALKDAHALLAQGVLEHSYPHSWRSGAPLIFRTTPQWFISMEMMTPSGLTLREAALKAIGETRWVPPQSRNRIESMIAQRPDWCISRQRSWGVPIALFVSKDTGEVLRDESVLKRIEKIFREEGSDAWFARPAQDFLGNEYRADDYEQVRDIVDVWFESGSTHSFVLEARPELQWPASLYLEGSDQHRGWFHSSLLESVATRGRAPYDAVLTHGFVLDEQGRKMSKSLGNTVAPQKVCDESGADVLRLWVVGADYSDDVRIGPDILKQQTEIYRRFRNTLRYLLGNLKGFTAAERIAPENFRDMPELERWVLHRLAELDGTVRQAIADFDFNRWFVELHNFCAVDLSAFYFDIRKDCLYCDAPSAFKRRAARTVLEILFETLTAWLAPVLCFTAEEAWLAWVVESGRSDLAESVHLRLFPQIDSAWRDEALAAKWARLRDLRRVVTGALEIERKNKTIGSSLQAAPIVFIADAATAALARSIDMSELVITSGVELQAGEAPANAFTLPDVAGVGIVFAPAQGHKCERCWKVLPDTKPRAAGPMLCDRCDEAVAEITAAAS